MVRLAAFALAAVLSGCVSLEPPSVRLVPVSAAAGEGALDCALAQVAALGYSVEAAEAGVFFKATRARTVGAFDVLSASHAQLTLTVVPSRELVSEHGRYTYEPLAPTLADAESVADACGSASATAGGLEERR